jgi:hypothetical protein
MSVLHPLEVKNKLILAFGGDIPYSKSALIMGCNRFFPNTDIENVDDIFAVLAKSAMKYKNTGNPDTCVATGVGIHTDIWMLAKINRQKP